MRKAINGDLIAPRLGNPPDCPEGFLRDPTDARRFIRVKVPCDLRSQEFIKKACCGGGTTRTYCEIIGRISYLICDDCQGDKEWAIQYRKKYG